MFKPGIYKHFKGTEYRALFIAKHSETLEELVVYEPLHGGDNRWIRPLSMFIDNVERDDYKGPRFIFLRES